jgi:hypothetical protein
MQIDIRGLVDPNQKRKIKEDLEQKITECLEEVLSDKQQATCKLVVEVKQIKTQPKVR